MSNFRLEGKCLNWTETFILFRIFLDSSLEVVRQLLTWFESAALRDRVTRILLLWVSWLRSLKRNICRTTDSVLCFLSLQWNGSSVGEQSLHRLWIGLRYDGAAGRLWVKTRVCQDAGLSISFNILWASRYYKYLTIIHLLRAVKDKELRSK